MPYRLVQQNARPARPEHHGHGAGGCGPRIKVDEGLIDRALGVILDPRLGEIGVVAASTAARAAAFTPAVLFCDDLYGQAHQRPHVGGHDPVRTGHQHHLIFGGERGHDLCNTLVQGARLLLHAFEDFDFFGVGQGNKWIVLRIEHALLDRALAP